MYNFIISDIFLPILIFSLGALLFKTQDELFWYLKFISIIAVLLSLACYREYKLIKYIKVNYCEFYRRHSDRIGGRFWLKVLKHDLESLNDEYINRHMNLLGQIKHKLGLRKAKYK